MLPSSSVVRGSFRLLHSEPTRALFRYRLDGSRLCSLLYALGQLTRDERARSERDERELIERRHDALSFGGLLADFSPSTSMTTSSSDLSATFFQNSRPRVNRSPPLPSRKRSIKPITGRRPLRAPSKRRRLRQTGPGRRYRPGGSPGLRRRHEAADPRRPAHGRHHRRVL